MISNIDKLTGLYVKKYFVKRLEEELARTRRYKRPLTLILFEINYNYFMPEYNIRWAMVYTILKQFGALLLRQLRNVDLAGRYGGEMFSVLLPETPLIGGKIAAERIRKGVEDHTFLGDSMVKEVRLAVNCGTAAFPIHGKNCQELFSSAHQGLLISRNEGGNKVVICPHELYDNEGNSLLTIGLEDESAKKAAESKKADEPDLIDIIKSDNTNKNDGDSKDKEELKEEEKKAPDESEDNVGIKSAIEKKKEELWKGLEEKMGND
ncbi:MAG: GGDEF domain-containing protein [Candidatus Eremiobacteraeota bacterium]|nr:GGDEF domain-containing protein [Candidatus Eremiobacteraeota bacterium]